MPTTATARPRPTHPDARVAGDPMPEHLSIPEGELKSRTKQLNSQLNSQFLACHECGKTASEAGIKTLSKCSSCRAVQFCSKQCQRVNWQDGHKIECSNLRKHKETCPGCSNDSTEKQILSSQLVDFQNRYSLHLRNILSYALEPHWVPGKVTRSSPIAIFRLLYVANRGRRHRFVVQGLEITTVGEEIQRWKEADITGSPDPDHPGPGPYPNGLESMLTKDWGRPDISIGILKSFDSNGEMVPLLMVRADDDFDRERATDLALVDPAFMLSTMVEDPVLLQLEQRRLTTILESGGGYRGSIYAAACVAVQPKKPSDLVENVVILHYELTDPQNVQSSKIRILRSEVVPFIVYRKRFRPNDRHTNFYQSATIPKSDLVALVVFVRGGCILDQASAIMGSQLQGVDHTRIVTALASTSNNVVAYVNQFLSKPRICIHKILMSAGVSIRDVCVG